MSFLVPVSPEAPRSRFLPIADSDCNNLSAVSSTLLFLQQAAFFPEPKSSSLSQSDGRKGWLCRLVEFRSELFWSQRALGAGLLRLSARVDGDTAVLLHCCLDGSGACFIGSVGLLSYVMGLFCRERTPLMAGARLSFVRWTMRWGNTMWSLRYRAEMRKDATRRTEVRKIRAASLNVYRCIILISDLYKYI